MGTGPNWGLMAGMEPAAWLAEGPNCVDMACIGGDMGGGPGSNRDSAAAAVCNTAGAAGSSGAESGPSAAGSSASGAGTPPTAGPAPRAAAAGSVPTRSAARCTAGPAAPAARASGAPASAPSPVSTPEYCTSRVSAVKRRR
eukprot:3327715-Rhodomonas_salina.1